MMFMTAKVNFKKLLVILVAVVGVILAVVLMTSGKGEAEPTAATAGDNTARVKLLESMGWQVSASPVEAGKVRIPNEPSELFSRYNALQKSQGYDLSAYAGQTVMRYVYQVKNYPDATEPVYATLLVHKDQVIGADITDTGAKGLVRGLKLQLPQETTTPTEASSGTAPTE